MFSKHNTTSNNGWKKATVAALVGVSCVALGAQFYEPVQTQDQVEAYT
jgi:hypothetical protein